MDKFALAMYLDDSTSSNPFYLSAWEILNSYNPAGGSWWGHCNGWAAAAILTHEPTTPTSVEVDGHTLTFSTADIKGLLTEAHYSTYSNFYGDRYYGNDDDDITDLSPAAFTRLINFYIRQQGVPLVFDTTAGEAVWNFPAWAADFDITETTDPELASLTNINTATQEMLEALPGIGQILSARIIERREDYGAFQTTEEIMEIWGIGIGTYNDIKDLITIDAYQRRYDVSATVTFTTDGVDEDHIDGSLPDRFTKTWDYTLHTDDKGQILNGVWENEDEHPDFAWVPYENPRSAGSGSSENPYLPYGTLLETLGSDIERR